MLFNIGDFVSRNKYKNDLLFEIMDIKDDIAYLSGIDVRLIADSKLEDLKLEDVRNFDDFHLDLFPGNLDRSKYFYIPGRILHIDSSKLYLDRCMNLYKKENVPAYGVLLKEEEIKDKILTYLEDLKPDIVVITGHDSKNNSFYKNSNNFIDAVKVCRKYEKNQDKLIIIAGACQSNYEELIKAGATFASSPKRINIHALDPAIVASCVSLTDRNKITNLIEILDKTKYGSDGIGGIETNGCMFVGYPR